MEYLSVFHQYFVAGRTLETLKRRFWQKIYRWFVKNYRQIVLHLILAWLAREMLRWCIHHCVTDGISIENIVGIQFSLGRVFPLWCWWILPGISVDNLPPISCNRKNISHLSPNFPLYISHFLSIHLIGSWSNKHIFRCCSSFTISHVYRSVVFIFRIKPMDLFGL